MCGFHKKRVGTRYVELVFLHPAGSAGHVMHNGVTGAQNIDTPFFILGWLSEVSKKRVSIHITRNMCFCIR
jgi:hypothetical protein